MQESEAEKFICHSCVLEPVLNKKIVEKGCRHECSYCGKRVKCLSMEDLADDIETAFRNFYYRTAEEQDEYDYNYQHALGTWDGWERSGYPLIGLIEEEAQIPSVAAKDIAEILANKNYDKDKAELGEESDFAVGSYYDFKGPDDPHWETEWSEFEKSIKSRSRFFNREAERLLNEIFADMEELSTYIGEPVVINVGPDGAIKELYRARAFQIETDLKSAIERPDLHLGPPPPKNARAGRMNAVGISVFYGTNDFETALAEVRPAVGSSVVVAKFSVIRPLKLLDIEMLSNIHIKGSIFDSTYIDKFLRLSFLKSISRRIIIPVLPNEELDYLSTQAIADFLANVRHPQIDGIIYRSIQTGGDTKNVVLFNKASRVEEYELPEGTSVFVHRTVEDLQETGGYEVLEEIPPIKKVRKKRRAFISESVVIDALDSADTRMPALKIDTSAITLYQIGGVKFAYKSHPVPRYRFEALNLNDDKIIDE